MSERRFRLFDVTLRMYGQSFTRPVSARSASAARYRAYVDADLSMTFAEYQRASSVRLSSGELADDGYGYIRRAYGVDPRIGQRLTLTREGADYEGKGGEVTYPGTSQNYVHVLLDGQEHPVVVHPHSVVLQPLEERR
jgi:hypothetical protein